MPLKSGEQNLLDNFGANVRRIRMSRGWTLEHLANTANIELSQVYRLEKAKINPKLTTIIILCNALEVKPEELIVLK
ncbi:helix-turn-helix domain-containing protein [Pedobacter sp. UC225_65]|uniref:helix-turn-helix domain-containing protein n=1 Tax=Pedobacter sp. UC225_65 TaxID=3350173 RepID=UPI003671DFF3